MNPRREGSPVSHNEPAVFSSVRPVGLAEIFLAPYTGVSGVPLASDRGFPDLVF